MKRITLVLIFISAYGIIARAEIIQPGQGFIDVPGGPVWYRVSGDGAGIPLIVLHGGPGGTSCGLSLLEELGGERDRDRPSDRRPGSSEVFGIHPALRRPAPRTELGALGRESTT